MKPTVIIDLELKKLMVLAKSSLILVQYFPYNSAKEYGEFVCTNVGRRCNDSCIHAQAKYINFLHSDIAKVYGHCYYPVAPKMAKQPLHTV